VPIEALILYNIKWIQALTLIGDESSVV